MTLDDVLYEWEKDMTEPVNDLGSASMANAKLHAKYLGIRSRSKIKAEQKKIDYKEERDLKRRYFQGDLNNPDDLAAYGLEPYRGPSTKLDVDARLESDKQLNELLMKKVHYDEIVSACDAIIRELNNRTYAIGSSIKWECFKGGSN